VSWTCLKDGMVTARKPHRCYLCGELIATREKHHRRVGVNGREMIEMRMHSECEAETHDWDAMDWESFDETEFTRPT
jgi:hypothetical protein